MSCLAIHKSKIITECTYGLEKYKIAMTFDRKDLNEKHDYVKTTTKFLGQTS